MAELGKTAKYYRRNEAARKRRLQQQREYDNGTPRVRSKRTKEGIRAYHRSLARWNKKNKAKKSNAQKKAGGPVDAAHTANGIRYLSRKHNRGAEVRKRNAPSNPYGRKGAPRT